ncbi:general stress protein [Stella sp.]|uniref:general stress protein n=1 Tax=Stella sp. TaxID=2912054 RepID=UPI0035B22419
MKTTVSRLYDSYDDAARAVNGLVDAGIPQEDIGIVASNVEGRTVPTVVETTDAGGGAGTGAGIGGLLGGGAGLLAGLGMLAIPGLGPVVAAGWLASTAAGAVAGVAAGAVTGGIIGALTNAGVSEVHANVYAEGVRRGGALVTARVDDERLPAANAILDRHGPVDPEARGRAYREGGWSRFDEGADPYTAEQVARERRFYERGPMI